MGALRAATGGRIGRALPDFLPSRSQTLRPQAKRAHTLPSLDRPPLHERWRALEPIEPLDEGIPVTDTQRMVAALVGLAVFVLGLLPLGPAAMLAEVLFLQFGLGLGICLFLRGHQQHRMVLYSLVLGPSLLILLTTAMARLGWWHVDVVAPWWIAASVLALLGALAASARDRIRRPQPLGLGPAVNPKLLAAEGLAVAGWVLAFATAAMNQTDPQPAGMILTAGPLWILGFVLLVSSAIWSALAVPRALPLVVTLAASIVPFSQAAMYGLPTVIVGGRHVGLGVYLNYHGSLLPNEDIYQAWVGLFAGTAFITHWVGMQEPLDLANWWGAIIAPVLALSVRAVAGRWIPAPHAWLAALIFAMCSTLVTPYYSPQSFALVVSLTLVVVLAGWREHHTRQQSAHRLVFALVISSAMAVTHQLSPYLISVAFFALVVAGMVRPWWIPVVVLGPAMIWMLVNFQRVLHYINPGAIGNVVGNLAPPAHPPPPVGTPLANTITFGAPAAMLLVVGLVAVYRLYRVQSRLALGLTMASASPVAIMSLTDYGSEGIFRVALFALPWLSILVMLPVTGRRVALGGQRLIKAAAAIGIAAMMVVNAIGMTGMDWARVMRHDDVNVIRYHERHAPPRSYFMNLGSNLSTSVALTENYMEMGYFSRDSVVEYFAPGRYEIYPTETGDAYDAEADLADLTRLFLTERAPAYYAYVSDASMAYTYRYGLQRPSDYMKLREAIAASPDWQQEYRSGDSILYRYVGELPQR